MATIRPEQESMPSYRETQKKIQILQPRNPKAEVVTANAAIDPSAYARRKERKRKEIQSKP
jgi:hypothetical protein